MTTAQVVETESVTVNNNSPIQNYVHPDDQTQPTLIIRTYFVHKYKIQYLYQKPEVRVKIFSNIVGQ